MNARAIHAIAAIARKEIEDHLRSGWVLAIAVTFAVFAVVIAFAGFGFTGSLQGAEEENALLSLTSLVIYLIPLLGLLLGYDGIVGERERGTLDLLLSYPLDPVHLLLGKWLGLGAVLAGTLFLGLIAPIALALGGGQSLVPWLVFAALSAWLGWIFVAVALLLSTLGRERGRMLGLAIALWVLLVVLFDLGLIGLLVATEGGVPPALISALFYANPTSLFRFLNLTLLLSPEALAATGLGEAVPALWGLVTALLGWTVLPLVGAGMKIRRA